VSISEAKSASKTGAAKGLQVSESTGVKSGIVALRLAGYTFSPLHPWQEKKWLAYNWLAFFSTYSSYALII